MDKILLLFLDELTYTLPRVPAATIRQICFPSLPDIHFKQGVMNNIQTARKKGMKVVLAACGDEREIKEALLSLSAFPLFDNLIIADEIKKGCSIAEQKDIIFTELKKRFAGKSLIFQVI